VCTTETPSNVTDVAAPIHVVRQCYFVAPTALARPKWSDPQKKIREIITKVLNKKGLKYKKVLTVPAGNNTTNKKLYIPSHRPI